MNEQSFKPRVFAVLLISFLIFFSAVHYVSYGLSSGVAYKWQQLNGGLYGADITILAGDLNYPNTIYAGTQNEGIFVSNDLGDSWSWIGNDFELNVPGYLKTYVKVNDIKTVKGANGLIYAATFNGLYMTTNGGTSWTIIGGAVLKRKVYSIYIDDKNPSNIYVGTDNGVYRSFDKGVTFEEANKDMQSISIYCLMPDASMVNSIYLGTSAGVYKTTDGGDTWLSVSGGLEGLSVYSIVQNPQKPYLLFAGTSVGVYRSFDYGGQWARVIGKDNNISVKFVDIDKFNTNLIFAVAGQGAIESNDGGETWNWVVNGSAGIVINSALTRGSFYKNFYLGSNRGFMEFDNGITVWKNQNLGLLKVTAMAYDENYHVLYSIDSLGLFKLGSLDSWNYVNSNLSGSFAYAVAIDRAQPNLMLAAIKYGILKSIDNGQSWSQINFNFGGEAYAVAFSYANPKIIYVGGESGLYISTDSGDHWKKWSVSIPEVPIYSISCSRFSDNAVYVLTQSNLYKSVDFGKTWSIINANIQELKGVTLAVDYLDSNIIYLGSLNGIYYSIDGGLTFSTMGDLPPNTAVYSIVVLPDANNTVYVGTNSGVYKRIIVSDITPPTLRIISPQDNTKTDSGDLIVTGTATDSESGMASVTVNGMNVSLDNSGVFLAHMPLIMGENIIEILAKDKAGNVSSQIIHVNYSKRVVLFLFIDSQSMTTSDGKIITLDSPPVIIESRTLVPIRAVIETLGGTVGWDATERKVTVNLGGITLELWIGKNTAKVNGTTVLIDSSNTKVVPQIISGRTMLPVRFVAESLGAKVDWDGTAKKITITYPAP